jgi:hypothetical protein
MLRRICNIRHTDMSSVSQIYVRGTLRYVQPANRKLSCKLHSRSNLRIPHFAIVATLGPPVALSYWSLRKTLYVRFGQVNAHPFRGQFLRFDNHRIIFVYQCLVRVTPTDLITGAAKLAANF